MGEVNALSLLLRPFDPQRDVPQDVGLGGLSTEYLATESAPDFGYWNIPQIWWTQGGEPHLVSPEQANALALTYEEATGQRFPRFMRPGIGAEMAAHRSANGGASKNALASIGLR